MSQTSPWMAGKMAGWKTTAPVEAPVGETATSLTVKPVKGPHFFGSTAKLVRALQHEAGLSTREIAERVESIAGISYHQNTFLAWSKGVSEPSGEAGEKQAVDEALRLLRQQVTCHAEGARISPKEVAKVMASWRKALPDITLKELSARTGIPQGTLARWSAGRYGAERARVMAATKKLRLPVKSSG